MTEPTPSDIQELNYYAENNPLNKTKYLHSPGHYSSLGDFETYGFARFCYLNGIPVDCEIPNEAWDWATAAWHVGAIWPPNIVPGNIKPPIIIAAERAAREELLSRARAIIQEGHLTHI